MLRIRQYPKSNLSHFSSQSVSKESPLQMYNGLFLYIIQGFSKQFQRKCHIAVSRKYSTAAHDQFLRSYISNTIVSRFPPLRISVKHIIHQVLMRSFMSIKGTRYQSPFQVPSPVPYPPLQTEISAPA